VDVVGPPVPAPADSPRTAWAYVAAGAAMWGTLLVLMNPVFGSDIRRWPWDLPTPSRWSRESAMVFVLGASGLALLCCAFLRPGPGRAIGGSLASAMLVVGFAGRHDFLEVASYAAPLLSAVVAGALFGSLGAERRDGGRAVAGTSAAVLAAVLLYPAYVEPAEGETSSYTSPLVAHVRLLAAVERDFWRGILAVPSVLLFLYAAIALVGLARIALRGRALGWTGLALFAAAILYPLVYMLVDPWRDPEPYRRGDPAFYTLPPWQVGLRMAGDALLFYVVPAALGFFAATADLVRRPLREPETPAEGTA
jgi:hypothetical protein